MVMDDRQQWLESAEVEITQLADTRDTWEIVPISDAGKAKILPTTWVFRLKTYPDGTVKKYKARLVVRGDLQEGLSARLVVRGICRKVYRKYSPLRLIFQQ